MSKDFNEIADAVVDGAGMLREAAPKPMEAFGALGKATYAEGALTPGMKELIAMAIAVTVRCDGCVGYHARAAYQRGATREQLAEALTVAVHMGGGPSMVYAGDALRAYDTFAGAEG
jgi:AhpD family alkylhydroperoxidase